MRRSARVVTPLALSASVSEKVRSASGAPTARRRRSRTLGGSTRGLVVKSHLVVLLCAQALVWSQDSTARDEELPWVFNAPRAEGYTIDLEAIDPAPGTPLVRGATVTFKVTLSYELEIAPHGVIILVFQDEKNRGVSGDRPQTMSEVTEGKGSVTLIDTVVVPAKAKELRLFIPLMPDGIATTTGEVTLRYPIVKSEN